MARRRLLWVTCAVMVACAMDARSARAEARADDTCDIRVDPFMSTYMVTVGGAPYRNKRYLNYEDALMLRDVLLSAGNCARAADPKQCELKLAAAGHYVIMRDGVNFDRYGMPRTLRQARRFVGKLVRLRLCKMGKSPG